TSACLRWTNSRQRCRSSAAKSACRRRRCRKWVISPFARTRKATRSPFGNPIRTQNNCPEVANAFVVGLKTSKSQKIMSTENNKSEYLIIFRGSHWDKGLSAEELQKVTSQFMAWFERLKQEGTAKAGQPLEREGKIVSGKKGRNVADG